MLASLLLSVAAFPSQTTEGTEFWVTFMNNLDQYDESDGIVLELILSSRYDAEIMVENPQSGWNITTSVTANTIKKVTIPCSQAYTYAPATINNKGIRVTSAAPISLYASNYSEASYDASIVLPITGIGNEYAIQLFESKEHVSKGIYKEFCIVATENNTKVKITPHANTVSGEKPHVTYEVTLQRGQTYLVQSADGTLNLSGSHIISNNPVAVFAGHECALVPDGNTACDHIVEQQVPVNMWGKKFALTKTYGQTGD